MPLSKVKFFWASFENSYLPSCSHSLFISHFFVISQNTCNHPTDLFLTHLFALVLFWALSFWKTAPSVLSMLYPSTNCVSLNTFFDWLCDCQNTEHHGRRTVSTQYLLGVLSPEFCLVVYQLASRFFGPISLTYYGEFHGLYSPGLTKSWTWLSDFHFSLTYISSNMFDTKLILLNLYFYYNK